MPDGLVFDLDGTLWDATPATAKGWNECLAELGIDYPEVTAELVRSVTGMPHHEAVRAAFPELDEQTCRRLSDLTVVRDNDAIREHGALLYPSVHEGLRALHDRYPLFIVSNCQLGYVELFFEISLLQPLFRDWETWGNTGQPKSSNLGAVIARNGLKDPVMVGDTAGDEKAARDNGVTFAFMTYGFGRAESPDLTFHAFDPFVAHFLSP